MKLMLLTLCVVGVSFAEIMGCASVDAKNSEPLETVAHVDLNRYLGKWYEIASFPQKFSEGCVASTATYSLRKDGDIDVLNECNLERFDGSRKTARGIAKVEDNVSNAKLKVTFFWPFYGKYWIIDLGEKYDYAVVGHPNRNYLWVLSRAPQMEKEMLAAILKRVEKKGYDLQKLKMTPQPGY